MIITLYKTITSKNKNQTKTLLEPQNSHRRKDMQAILKTSLVKVWQLSSF